MRNPFCPTTNDTIEAGATKAISHGLSRGAGRIVNPYRANVTVRHAAAAAG